MRGFVKECMFRFVAELLAECLAGWVEVGLVGQCLPPEIFFARVSP